MLRNYLKIAFRTLGKQKLYTGINILGLTFGLVICMLAYLYLRYEFSYDQWYPNSEQIYRLNGSFILENEVDATALTPYPLSGAVAREIPEVVASTKLVEAWKENLISYDNKKIYTDAYASVDSSFFQVFGMPFYSGDPATALARPDQVVVSTAFAERFFGTKEAIGKTMRLNNKNEYTVSGVLAKSPGPSHFQFDFYLPYRPRPRFASNWTGMFNYYTYVKLHPKSQKQQFQEKLDQLVKGKLIAHAQQGGNADIQSPEVQELLKSIRISSIPITAIHLDSNLGYELEPSGDRTYVYTFLLVAFIMLLIACINFMNLATARSSHRAKEIGVRKVIGANRFGASLQLLIEAMVQSFIAALLAIILIELLIPIFNHYAHTALEVSRANFIPFGFATIGFALITSLLAGSYPALFLSGFQPVKVLKGDFSRSSEGATIRKGLVIFQFMVCASLIIFMLMVGQQIKFLQNKELGFHPQQVVIVPLQSQAMWEKPLPLKNKLKQHPGILEASISQHVPGDQMGGNVYESKNGHSAMLDFNLVDEDYLKVMDITLTQGRFFSHKDIVDTFPQYIVNEAFIREFNLGEDPIGEIISRGEAYNTGPIIGVVEDFHWKGFTETIRPTVMSEMDAWAPKLMVRVSPDQVGPAIQELKRVWSEFEPNYPMQYSFLDTDFEEVYAQYIRFGKILSYLTLLLIFTATLGLFGLATYTAEQRTKEIGIRKVLGASIPQILNLLISDFARLVLIAAITALPIGFWLSRQWLRDFAYQVDISGWPFLWTILLILLITIFTVGVQAYRVAISNPVKALKEE